jgi:hypothetical protein
MIALRHRRCNAFTHYRKRREAPPHSEMVAETFRQAGLSFWSAAPLRRFIV